ncbi:uncharacterized protein PHACADRAFT_133212 [Phanerochaete carnosa HHB-10118-sp]|uniref:CHAT domain-containing protein n=1 Tax=Phanerochaete carnosa (strain HHB-10118-sp) TaxID=650164 RepID=K5W9G6_PHACS|nr:uncharacterized protein PHACADRAFT_133212 [Phanerochaete carnosa HHB-10118-sp]EKM60603.1 hypothetical protein PHACADRAFT_133212 [Phanerochaete carnosa HHB-10118-sp]
MWWEDLQNFLLVGRHLPQWPGLRALRHLIFNIPPPDEDDETVVTAPGTISCVPTAGKNRVALLTILSSALFARLARTYNRKIIENAITSARKALSLSPPTDDRDAALLYSLAELLLCRFELIGRPADLDQCIEYARAAVSCCPPESPARPMSLDVLSRSLLSRYEHLGESGDLEEAIGHAQEAASLCSAGHLDYPQALATVAAGLLTRSKCTGKLDDMAQSVSLSYEALSHCSPAMPIRLVLLDILVPALITRFTHEGRQEDLEKSIEYGNKALALSPQGRPDRPLSVVNLAVAKWTRFVFASRREDIEDSVASLRQVAEPLSSGATIRAVALGRLADALRHRFMSYGALEDLEESIVLGKEALSTCDPHAPSRAMILNSLASSFGQRFGYAGEDEDFNLSMEYIRESLSLCPPGAVSRPDLLLNLAVASEIWFCGSGESDALTQSVGSARAALLLCSHVHPHRHRILEQLWKSLGRVFEQTGDLEDLEQCINYLEMALASLSQEAPLPPSDLMTYVNTISALASALAERSDLTTGGHRDDDLSRSVDLSYKALALCPIGHPSRYRVIDSLAFALRIRFGINGNLDDLDNAIIYMRESLEIKSDSLGFLNRLSTITALASALSSHFRLTRQPDDLRDSIKYSYEALSLCPPGHSGRAAVLWTLSSSLGGRFNMTRQSEDLNRSISFLREAISVDQDHKSPYHMNLLSALTQYLCIRANEIRRDAEARAEDLRECMRYIEVELHLCPPGDPDRSGVIRRFAQYHLCQYEQTRDPEDMQKAIDHFREALSLSNSSSLHLVNSLGRALIGRYRALQAVEDLDECIDQGHRMLSLYPLEQGHPEHIDLLYNLASSLGERHDKTGDQEDVSNAILYAREGALLESTAYRLRQLDCAILWAHLAHENGHHSAMEAYHRSLELLLRDLAITPTLEMQHEVAQNQQSLTLDAAAYAISQGDLELAGRMLEAVSTSANPFIPVSDAGERSDLYGHMLETKRRLSAELDDVIDQIRAKIPGFLRPPSYDRLKAASAEGPVIIVNSSRFRSDALILGPGDTLSCVKLVDVFFKRAVDLANDLLGARESLSTAPKKYDRVLRRTLEELADLVVGPVVERLKELGVKKGSRIWWCPTFAVSILPLHAAGPIAMPELRSSKGKVYLPDLYIPSYTPTLTALIESRATGGGRRVKHEGLLGVALLDRTLGAVGKEVEVLRAHFADSSLTLAIESHCNRETVTAGLVERPWVHFSCHGTLKAGEPLSSAFILSGGERITLLDIIKAGLHRDNAELAVLSACHTAEWTPDSALDEALNLAAAMQFSGFKSVVGTMWQLQDEDGPTFAKAFYDALFAEQRDKSDTPQGSEVGFKRAARALCSAAKEMRRNGANLERWVNFVHIGA